MKLRYLLPFLALPFLPQKSEAQFKAEVNPDTLDVKSEYVDVSLGNSLGLQNFENTRADIQVKLGENALYFLRNGVLNHGYGGNLNVGFLGGYYNRSNQGNRTEGIKTRDSPIGEIVTETTILEERVSQDFGISLNYHGFSAGYDEANADREIDGTTIITIDGETQGLVPFSSISNSESRVFGLGFDYGFFRFIQNRTRPMDGEEERFNNFLIGANYSFRVDERERANFRIYYGKDVSGFFNFNILRNLDVNLIYEGETGDFRAHISSPNYSRLNQRVFERGLEDRLRTVPRVRDFNLEIDMRYIRDMFFTDFISYDFSVNMHEGETTLDINANMILELINALSVLAHYSEESKAVGLKYRFAIGTYDFEQGKARIGVFFGRD